MRTRRIPARDLVIIELSSAPQVGSTVEVYPGIRVACDAVARLVRLEIHQASERIAADAPKPGTGPALRPHGECEPGATPPQAPPGPVTVYSDGGCLGNPGPGGWAARLRYADGHILELGGAEPHTTNNRMELTAAIEGLRQVGAHPCVTMVTDSEYLRRGITEWIHGWKRRGWVTAARKPVLNQDLWQKLDRLNRPSVEWRYTRGHAGDPDNERCDELARAFAQGQRPVLQGG